MSSEDSKAIAHRFVLEHNQAGYLATFDDLLAPQCTVHEYLPGVPESMNRAAYEQFIAMFRSAMPDINNTVEDMIAEVNSVAVRWVGKGTHTGAPLMGVPGSGAPVTAHGTYTFRLSGNHIVEIWNHWDNLNVLQKLGGMPGAK